MAPERKMRDVPLLLPEHVGKRVLVARTDDEHFRLQECRVVEFTEGKRVKVRWLSGNASWFEQDELELVEILPEKSI